MSEKYGMKLNIVEEIRNIIEQSKTWVRLEVEYAKLTIAEKLTMLLTSLILGFVCLLLFTVVLIMLSFCIAELFKMILVPSLAYLCTAGSILVFLLLLYLLRKPLILTPIARMITKIFFDKKH